MPSQSIDDQISALLNSGMDSAELGRRVRRAKVAKVCKHFCQDLTLDDGSPSIELTVHDWKDIRMFLRAAVTMEFNPGAIYDDVKADIHNAIEEKDAARLINGLLIMFKAVQG